MILTKIIIFHLLCTMSHAQWKCHKGGYRYCCENGGEGPSCCGNNEDCNINQINQPNLNIDCSCTTTNKNCDNTYKKSTVSFGMTEAPYVTAYTLKVGSGNQGYFDINEKIDFFYEA